MQKIRTQLNNYHKQYRIPSLILLSLLILGLGYFFLIMPLRAQRLEAAENLDKLRAQIAVLRSYDIPADEFLNKQSELSAIQQYLQSLLPDNSDNFSDIMQLTGAIKANNLNVRSIKISNPVTQSGHQLQRLDCIVSGGYFELIALLEYLQKRQPFTNVQINSINLEADEKLSVSMQVHTYTLK